MNRLLLSALALLALANMALAYVCAKNICDTVRCAPLTEDDCNDTIVPKSGGYCSCCDGCIHYLKEGEQCPTTQIKGGTPSTTKCGVGLVCNRQTGRCEAAQYY